MGIPIEIPSLQLFTMHAYCLYISMTLTDVFKLTGHQNKFPYKHSFLQSLYFLYKFGSLLR